ncbi:unnamed protein product [Trichogramma brassicae]|uniref:Uncharacterized protein n=1 Tax=Trichogramma brassicae TaxID=86971 RepID=A0A6H5IFG9_9HYME|nr:unnamed protein product [Trichogramma brassicae]
MKNFYSGASITLREFVICIGVLKSSTHETDTQTAATLKLISLALPQPNKCPSNIEFVDWSLVLASRQLVETRWGVLLQQQRCTAALLPRQQQQRGLLKGRRMDIARYDSSKHEPRCSTTKAGVVGALLLLLLRRRWRRRVTISLARVAALSGAGRPRRRTIRAAAEHSSCQTAPRDGAGDFPIHLSSPCCCTPYPTLKLCTDFTSRSSLRGRPKFRVRLSLVCTIFSSPSNSQSSIKLARIPKISTTFSSYYNPSSTIPIPDKRASAIIICISRTLARIPLLNLRHSALQRSYRRPTAHFLRTAMAASQATYKLVVHIRIDIRRLETATAQRRRTTFCCCFCCYWSSSSSNEEELTRSSRRWSSRVASVRASRSSRVVAAAAIAAYVFLYMCYYQTRCARQGNMQCTREELQRERMISRTNARATMCVCMDVQPSARVSYIRVRALYGMLDPLSPETLVQLSLTFARVAAAAATAAAAAARALIPVHNQPPAFRVVRDNSDKTAVIKILEILSNDRHCRSKIYRLAAAAAALPTSSSELYSEETNVYIVYTRERWNERIVDKRQESPRRLLPMTLARRASAPLLLVILVLSLGVTPIPLAPRLAASPAYMYTRRTSKGIYAAARLFHIAPRDTLILARRRYVYNGQRGILPRRCLSNPSWRAHLGSSSRAASTSPNEGYMNESRRGCESSQQLKQRNAWIAHRKRRPKDSQVSSPSNNATVTGCEMDARVQIYIRAAARERERTRRMIFRGSPSMRARGPKIDGRTHFISSGSSSSSSFTYTKIPFTNLQSSGPLLRSSRGALRFLRNAGIANVYAAASLVDARRTLAYLPIPTHTHIYNMHIYMRAYIIMA